MEISDIVSDHEQDFFRLFIKTGKLSNIKKMLDINIIPDQGTIDFAATPYDREYENNHLKAIEFFQSHPLTCNLKCSQDIFEKCCNTDRVEFVRLLTRNGFHWDRKVHIMDSAINNKNVEMVKLLHNFGLTCSDKMLNVAIDNMDVEMVKLLHSFGLKFSEYQLRYTFSNHKITKCSDLICYLYDNNRTLFTPKFFNGLCDRQAPDHILIWLMEQDNRLYKCIGYILRYAIDSESEILTKVCLERIEKPISDKFVYQLLGQHRTCQYCDDSDYDDE
jgi:hypothetical protein